MNLNRIWKFSFFSILLLLFSCSKEVEELTPTLSDYKSYYPTTIDFWVDYQIDSIQYTKSSVDTTVTIKVSTTYLREQIIDTVKAFDSPYQFQIKSFIKHSLTDNWTFYQNYTILPTNNGVEKNENNLRFIKLQFPINSSIQWKGNKYIDTSILTDFGNWNYRYSNIFEPYSIHGFSFNKTVKVQQYIDSNVIEYTNFFEVYAKNIGLVYSEYNKLEKQNVYNYWNKPENGYTIRKTIIDWKK